MAMKPVPLEAQNAMLQAVGLPNNEVRKAIDDAGGLPMADLTTALRGKDANVQVGALWVLGDMGKHDSGVWPILLAAMMVPCAVLLPINSPMPRTPMRRCWCQSFARC